MGVTSSGLLDEEIEDATGTGSSTEIDSPDTTLTESGEDGLGTQQVCFRGPTKYKLP
jgi:hypothetical protein